MPEAEERDVRLGQLAYRAGLVTEFDLEEALLEQERRAEQGFQTKLGELMVSMSLITERQLERLLGAQAVVHAKISRIGPYRLIAKLGAGGMGAVYQGRDARTDEFVALKVLPRSKARNPGFLARFEQEARAVFELDHPNIVRAVGMGEADGYHYLAMEYVDGQDVYDILEEKGRIPEHEALQIVIQIAQALEHAAEEQVVHRDIKPGNILVDRHGLAKLTDFGLALDRDRIGRGRITAGAEALGTPFYLSPELARTEQDVDVRSDIYSLGATLYEMVTGRPPFEGPPVVVMSKHLREQIPSPSEFDRTLSPGICKVVQKMMAKRREDRYQTPRELLRDLMLVYQGAEPLSAGLPSHKSSVRTSLRAPRRRPGRMRYRPAQEPRRGVLVGRGARAPDLPDRRPRSAAAKPDDRASKETQFVSPPVKQHPVVRAFIEYRAPILAGVGAGLFTLILSRLLIWAPAEREGPPPAAAPGPREDTRAASDDAARRLAAPTLSPHRPSPNERLILRSDFESGTTEGWWGTILSQGAGDGAHSLQVLRAALPARGLATRASVPAPPGIPPDGRLALAFLYYLDGEGPIVVEVGAAAGVRLKGVIEEPVRKTWASACISGEMSRRIPQASPDGPGASDFGEIRRAASSPRAVGPQTRSSRGGAVLAPGTGEKQAEATVSIGAPRAGPLDVLALDSIRLWSQ